MPHDAESNGMILRTINGHSEMANFQLKRAPDGSGYWAWVECHLERADLPAAAQATYNPVHGHWLAPNGVLGALTGHVDVQTTEYVWSSAHEALAAIEQWHRQQR